MIVDDEELMRSLLRDFFTSQGYRVDCYATGAAALKAMQSEPALSAVVADIRMVPMNGMELLQKMKADRPQLPVVLFTSAGSPDERDEALRSGAATYLTKPFSLTDLQRVLDQLIQARDLPHSRRR